MKLCWAKNWTAGIFKENTGTGILKRLDETKKGVAHKAPFYYKFDLKKYKKALKAGMGFELS